MHLSSFLEELEIKKFNHISEIMIEFINETDLIEGLSMDGLLLNETVKYDVLMIEAVGFNKTSNATKKETIKVSDKSPVLSKKALVNKLFKEIEDNKSDVISGKISKAIPIARITFITKGSKSVPGAGGLASEHTIWGLSSSDVTNFKGAKSAIKAAKTKAKEGGINIKTKANGAWRTIYSDKISTLYLSSVKRFFKVDSKGKHPAIGSRIKKYCKAVATQKVKAIKSVTSILDDFNIDDLPTPFSTKELELRLFKELTSDKSVEAQEADFKELANIERMKNGITPAEEYAFKFDIISFRNGKATVHAKISTIALVESMGFMVGRDSNGKKSFTAKWSNDYTNIKRMIKERLPNDFEFNNVWVTGKFTG